MIPSTLPLNIYQDGIEYWKWAIPDGEIRPIILTSFGDWIYETKNEGIKLLSILDGTVEKIASSHDELALKIKDPANRDNWFLEGFVIKCNINKVDFSLGKCLGWKLQPIIGGKFQYENIGVYDYKIYWHIASQIVKQSRGICFNKSAQQADASDLVTNAIFAPAPTRKK